MLLAGCVTINFPVPPPPGAQEEAISLLEKVAFHGKWDAAENFTAAGREYRIFSELSQPESLFFGFRAEATGGEIITISITGKECVFHLEEQCCLPCSEANFTFADYTAKVDTLFAHLSEIRVSRNDWSLRAEDVRVVPGGVNFTVLGKPATARWQVVGTAVIGVYSRDNGDTRNFAFIYGAKKLPRGLERIENGAPRGEAIEFIFDYDW